MMASNLKRWFVAKWSPMQGQLGRDKIYAEDRSQATASESLSHGGLGFAVPSIEFESACQSGQCQQLC